MRLIRKPFKGNTFYELQVGPIVFQVKHKRNERNEHFRLIHIWRDPYWRR